MQDPDSRARARFGIEGRKREILPALFDALKKEADRRLVVDGKGDLFRMLCYTSI